MNMEDNNEVSSFKDLGVCEQLVEACDNLGWKTPSKIQALVLPYALKGNDVICLASIGSGKTGAFAIPILQSLLENPEAAYACVLSPTRERAIQIAEQFKALMSGIGMKCSVLVGGVAQVQQSIPFGKRPHIIVGTPGRLVDLLSNSNTEEFLLCTLKYLVLDEADRLLKEGFEKALYEILKFIPRERKTYLYYATMTKEVQKLHEACLKNPAKISATVDTLKHQHLVVPACYKDCYLYDILFRNGESKSVVFTRTCEATQFLTLVLRNLDLKVISITGQMTQTERLGHLNMFKDGINNILVCTDVAIKGLDIPSADMIISYDIPTNSKDYIHRVGSTVRAGRSGVAILLVSEYESEWYLQIEKLIGKIPEFQVEAPKDYYVSHLFDLVSIAKTKSILGIKEDGENKRSLGTW